MSNDLNSCNFIGRLGKDPESRFMPNGDAVSSFSIAVGWKTKDKEGAEWVNISAFGKLAEICNQYLVKGSQIFVSGRMKTEKWTDREGNDRYTTKIVADRMQMLGGKSDRPASDSADDSEKHAPKTPPASKPAESGFDDDSDIPF
jgi:single-strand DNA-binding protein